MAGRPGEINVLGAGRSYGWPRATAASTGPVATMPTGYDAPGGCSVGTGTLFVTTLDGKAVLQARIGPRGNQVTLRGEQPEVALVERLLDELVTIIRTGQGVTGETVERAIGI